MTLQQEEMLLKEVHENNIMLKQALRAQRIQGEGVELTKCQKGGGVWRIFAA